MQVERSRFSPLGLEVAGLVLGVGFIAFGEATGIVDSGFGSFMLLLGPPLVLVFGASFLLRLTKHGRLSSLLDSLPEAHLSDAQPGDLVRVTGTISGQGELTDPVYGQKCAYFKATVSRQVLGSEDPAFDWLTAVTMEDAEPFMLETGDAKIQVRVGARILSRIEVEPQSVSYSNTGFAHPALRRAVPGRVRLQVVVLGEGDTITVVGRLQSATAGRVDAILEPVDGRTTIVACRSPSTPHHRSGIESKP